VRPFTHHLPAKQPLSKDVSLLRKGPIVKEVCLKAPKQDPESIQSGHFCETRLLEILGNVVKGCENGFGVELAFGYSWGYLQDPRFK